MSALESYAAYVASGAAGASHSILSSFGPSSLPGQKMWLTFIYEATRTSGTGILTLDAKVHWYDVNDVEIGSPSTTSISINATVGRTFKEFVVTVPANATKCKVEFVATPAASPMQHDLWITKVRLGKTQLLATSGATWGQDIADPSGTLPEDNATVDAAIVCETNVIIYADSSGVPKTGELTRTVALTLYRLGVAVTSGVTWSATVISGNATIATNGTGLGALDITGPNNNTFSLEHIIRVTSTYNGVGRAIDIKVIRQDDPPTNTGGSGGGSGSSTTTLGATTGTAYDVVNSVSATLTVTAGANGEVACAAPITFKRDTLPSAEGTSGAFGKWQWRVPAGAWADIFTEVASTSNSVTTYNDVLDKYNTSAGQLNVNQTKNGLTPGNSYEFRFIWRQVNVAGTPKILRKTGTTALTATGQ